MSEHRSNVVDLTRFDRVATESADTLHARFVSGCPEAVSNVTTIVAGIVHHRGYYINRDDRADVIQETMLDLFDAAARNRFDGDGRFHAFLRCVTHRRCVDWLRQQRRLAGLQQNPEDLAGPDDALLAKERKVLGSVVLARLKKGCRDLFALHAGLGLTYRQMANHFGRTEGALRTQAYECLKHARTVLDGICRRKPSGGSSS